MTGDDLVRILDADAVAAAELDPLRQSGFFGDATTWEAHRRPMLHAVDRDGSFLDVGCASGYLLECVVQWPALGGRALEPFGVDVGPQLVELAKRRLPQWADRFFVGDAREWTPPMRFDLGVDLLK